MPGIDLTQERVSKLSALVFFHNIRDFFLLTRRGVTQRGYWTLHFYRWIHSDASLQDARRIITAHLRSSRFRFVDHFMSDASYTWTSKSESILSKARRTYKGFAQHATQEHRPRFERIPLEKNWPKYYPQLQLAVKNYTHHQQKLKTFKKFASFPSE